MRSASPPGEPLSTMMISRPPSPTSTLAEALDAREGVVGPVVVDDDDGDPTGMGDPDHAKGYPGASSSPGWASPASPSSTRPSLPPGRSVTASNVRTVLEAASARNAADEDPRAPPVRHRAPRRLPRGRRARRARGGTARSGSPRGREQRVLVVGRELRAQVTRVRASPSNRNPSPKMHGTCTSSNDG